MVRPNEFGAMLNAKRANVLRALRDMLKDPAMCGFRTLSDVIQIIEKEEALLKKQTLLYEKQLDRIALATGKASWDITNDEYDKFE